MKTYKYIGLVATALMMGACSDGALVEDVVNTPNAGGETVDMTAEVVTELDMQPEENADGSVVPQTKTVMDAGQVTSWTNGDQISVSDGTLMYKYEVENANGASCTFTVVDGEKSIDHDGFKDDFNGCYPAAAVKGWNGTTVTAQVYAEQNYAENIDGGCFGAYMMTQGTVADNHISFKFKHAASVLEVNLATLGVTPKAVYLKANSGVNICGTIKCDAATGAITVTSPASSYCSSNDCDVIGLVNVASDATIARFYLLPVQIQGGVTVTVVDADGNYYTKSTSTTIGNTDGANTINKGTAVKPFYKKVNFGTAASATRKGNWMATVPSNTYMTMLSIPGTHDSATNTLSSATTGKCQNEDIATQLTHGIRMFDLRPSTNLTIYHGISSTGVTFSTAVNSLKDYVTNNPTETVYAMIHYENGKESDQAEWSNGVYNIVKAVLDEGKAVDNISSNLKLNDCKGKIIFIYRDDLTGDEDKRIYNAGRVAWSDNVARTVYVYNKNNQTSDLKISYQDIYDGSNAGKTPDGLDGYPKQKAGVTDKSAKTEIIKTYINLATQTLDRDRMTLNFASYANGNPSTNANSIMPTINAYIAEQTERVGIIMTDYESSNYGGMNFTKLMINHNYKYLYKGRTRNVEAPTGGIGIDIAGDDKADEEEVFARKEK